MLLPIRAAFAIILTQIAGYRRSHADFIADPDRSAGRSSVVEPVLGVSGRVDRSRKARRYVLIQESNPR